MPKPEDVLVFFQKNSRRQGQVANSQNYKNDQKNLCQLKTVCKPVESKSKQPFNTNNRRKGFRPHSRLRYAQPSQDPGKHKKSPAPRRDVLRSSERKLLRRPCQYPRLSQEIALHALVPTGTVLPQAECVGPNYDQNLQHRVMLAYGIPPRRSHKKGPRSYLKEPLSSKSGRSIKDDGIETHDADSKINEGLGLIKLGIQVVQKSMLAVILRSACSGAMCSSSPPSSKMSNKKKPREPKKFEFEIPTTTRGCKHTVKKCFGCLRGQTMKTDTKIKKKLFGSTQRNVKYIKFSKDQKWNGKAKLRSHLQQTLRRNLVLWMTNDHDRAKLLYGLSPCDFPVPVMPFQGFQIVPPNFSRNLYTPDSSEGVTGQQGTRKTDWHQSEHRSSTLSKDLLADCLAIKIWTRIQAFQQGLGLAPWTTGQFKRKSVRIKQTPCIFPSYGNAVHPKAWERAALNGHIAILEHLIVISLARISDPAPSSVLVQTRYKDMGCPSEALEFAIEAGHFEVAKWLYNQMGPAYCGAHALERAAQGGHLEVLSWVESWHPKPLDLSSRAFDLAAGNGHMEVVKWLHSRGVQPSGRAVVLAAEKGKLPMLEWMFENTPRSILPNAVAWNHAALHGQLAVLEWFMKKDYCWATSRCEDWAKSNRHFHICKWLEANAIVCNHAKVIYEYF